MALPKEIVTEAIKFWEPRRIAYNIVLTIVVLVTAFFSYSEVSVSVPLVGTVVGVLVLAVAANLLYCAAYTVDVFIQQSDFQETWKANWRPWLFLGGTLFASILTWACSMMFFAPFTALQQGL